MLYAMVINFLIFYFLQIQSSNNICRIFKILFNQVEKIANFGIDGVFLMVLNLFMKLAILMPLNFSTVNN